MAPAKTPDLSLGSGKAVSTRADVLVVGVDPDLRLVDPAGDVGKAFGRGLAATLSTLGMKGKPGQVAKVPSGGAVKAALVVVVGLGKDEPTDEALRRAAAHGIKAVSNAATVAFALPTPRDSSVQAIAEGVLLGGYAFDRYKTEADDDRPHGVTVITDRARTSGAKDALARAVAVSSAVSLARDWVNTPAGDLRPPGFADEARAAVAASSASSKVKVTVWDEEKLAREKCGGILGVGRASTAPPRLVTLTYKPRKAVAHLALVGKGITFDSGGLSLKPGASMMTMKCDMAGAAAVLAATIAIAELGLPVQVTAYAAMAENMVSGDSTRPGDVLTMRGGTTVEVHNTDAEGRLVLGDALVLATEQQPDVIVDVATLTGAAVVALGDRTAGVLSNDDVLRRRIPEVAETVGEAFWPLPITEEIAAKVTTSDIADLRQHNPKPAGGTLFAAAFLSKFVGDTRWAHLDIAGPAFSDTAFDYTPKGGTGSSVRTLVAIADELVAGGLAEE
ncbi:leucyl aminopeptidase [Solicola sp. PLA-1-18]|uniref:leucyl aminopeptidase n=1 Tax=Solicola sp. PLA-1-18 TaxID=3380532 RepID=UPI003B7F76EE